MSQFSQQQQDLALAALGLGIGYLLYKYQTTYTSGNQRRHTCCGANTGKHEEGAMYPLSDPMFNVRECCKEMVLLEQHLNEPRKRCRDCIMKHFLTIEGLLEEANGLDKQRTYQHVLDGKPRRVKVLALQFSKNEDPVRIAQHLRGIRKELTGESFEHVF